MSVGTVGLGIAVVALIAALRINDKEYERKQNEFENS